MEKIKNTLSEFCTTFVEGKEKSGKTTFLQYCIQKKHFTYCIVNTVEEIETKYKNEDWLILDNFDDKKINLFDLIITIVACFDGKNLVITSSKPLNKWYNYKDEKSSTLDVFVSLIDIYVKCEQNNKTILADVYIADKENQVFVLNEKKDINFECFSHCQKINIDKFYKNKNKK